MKVRTRVAQHLICICLLVEGGCANAVPQAAFDLHCVAKSGKTFQLRLDLSQKKWCIEKCYSVLPITEIDDQKFAMEWKASAQDDYWSMTINRYTSEFVVKHSGYDITPDDIGQCTAGNFSGFPQKRF